MVTAMRLYKVLSLLGYLGFSLVPLLCSQVNKILAVPSFSTASSATALPFGSVTSVQSSREPGLADQSQTSLIPSPMASFEKAFYVAPNGDDSNPGTLERPWRTIQKAADTLLAGDTVYLRQGIYAEHVRPKNSGQPGKEIAYLSFPGERVILDGQDVLLPDDLSGLFEIANQSYIRVRGMHLINSGPFADNAAILILASDHITVENNTTFNTASSGIGVWGSSEIVIAGNTVERAGVGGGQECITVAGSQGFEVHDNLVIDCQKEGIDAKDGSSHGIIDHNVVKHPKAVGIYVDAWDKPTHDITVSRNVVFNSAESNGFAMASEMGGLLANIRLENNLAYHNHTYGIEVSACCSANHPMNEILIINNTLYQNGVDWGGGIIQDNAQAQRVIIRNNIVSQNLTFQIAVAGDVPTEFVSIDHNLIEGYRGYEDEVIGVNDLEGNAGFLDPLFFDFHLSPASTAIDRGSSLDAPATDFDGDARPIGKGVDIGADEWHGVAYLPLIKNWVGFMCGYSLNSGTTYHQK